MDKVTGKLTVFFEKPFGVGGFERTEAGRLSACRVTFDAEPKEYEVRAFVLENYYKLTFSPSIEVSVKRKSLNPKMLQREVRKQTLSSRISTKSQQALQLQQEEMKIYYKAVSKEERKAEQERKRELRQQKRKQKHRGR